MAEIDENIPLNLLQTQIQEDHEPEDEAQDFRLLKSLTFKSNSAQNLKRGEKDFEPHGTKHQDGILAASRQAMHEALNYTRKHIPKNHVRAFYYGEDSLVRGEVVEEMFGHTLADEYVVCVEKPRGSQFKTMGRSTVGVEKSTLWLLPEEALYLVERGNLDLWWPGSRLFQGTIAEEMDSENESGKGVGVGGREPNGQLIRAKTHAMHDDAVPDGLDKGVPMSFQAAYALLIGEDGEKGKVSLNSYTVYTNLKRNGFAVQRTMARGMSATSSQEDTQKVSNEQTSLFTWLFGSYFTQHSPPPSYDSLVRHGMYRSYSSIYQHLAVVPRHKPSEMPIHASPPPAEPFKVDFDLWKPSEIKSFSKSKPGEPDFRVAVVDAHVSTVPSLKQITSLLESTPWHPPAAEVKGRMYGRLRHGWRNVIIAVIDQGVTSYLTWTEAAFGEERLYETFDRACGRGCPSKRGRSGRAHGRGRGRDR